MSPTEEITLETFVGDVEETAITNEMKNEPGYPARTNDGDLILIVGKESMGSNSRMKLIDADGGEWEDNVAGGGLIEWDDDAPTYNKAAPKEKSSKSQPKEPAAA